MSSPNQPKSKGEGEDHPSFYEAQDTFVFLGCNHTLLAHVPFFIHQYSEVFLGRDARNPFISHSVLMLGTAQTRVQNLALGLVELHELHLGPSLKLAKLPLDDLPSL